MKINQYIVLSKKLLFRHFEESNFESVFNLGIQRETNFKRYFAWIKSRVCVILLDILAY